MDLTPPVVDRLETDEDWRAATGRGARAWGVVLGLLERDLDPEGVADELEARFGLERTWAERLAGLEPPSTTKKKGKKGKKDKGEKGKGKKDGKGKKGKGRQDEGRDDRRDPETEKGTPRRPEVDRAGDGPARERDPDDDLRVTVRKRLSASTNLVADAWAEIGPTTAIRQALSDPSILRGTDVEMDVRPDRKSSRVQVKLTQRGIATEKDREELRDAWKWLLDRLRARVSGRYEPSFDEWLEGRD